MGFKLTKKRRFSRKKSRKYSNKIRPGQNMEEYTARNALLIEIGFKDYKAYLRSKLWKSIRLRKLESNPTCYVCDRDEGNAVMQVHHSAYNRANLLGESQEHLWTLCARCHKWIEITRSGYKRNPADATKEMFRIRKLALQRSARCAIRNLSCRSEMTACCDGTSFPRISSLREQYST